ncbi:MAG: hypothetical protein D6718_03785 [Acidobacteria bacterium]|nr:MAG: hypothetical protein D6718_03785 [Acidobacteriota bacterium]
MRRTTTAALAALLLLSCGTEGNREAQALIDRYVALHRAHDLEGLLAMHSEDSVFVLPGKKPIRGRRALADLFEWDFVMETELEMHGIEREGDTIRVASITERNAFFRALGLDGAVYRPGTRFVLRGGLIAATYPAPLTAATLEAGMPAYREFLAWLDETHPGLRPELFPETVVRHDARRARVLRELLDEWPGRRALRTVEPR